jgi:hypothetical protein
MPDCLSGLGFFVLVVWIVLAPIWIEALIR